MIGSSKVYVNVADGLPFHLTVKEQGVVPVFATEVESPGLFLEVATDGGDAQATVEFQFMAQDGSKTVEFMLGIDAARRIGAVLTAWASTDGVGEIPVPAEAIPEWNGVGDC